MVIAWTRLFHAYFNSTIGDRYYYKNKGKFLIIDGDRKSWDLGTCIKRYGILKAPIEKNLHFFISLRNKIEHRHIDKREVDTLIFGECQAFLYNYETLLIDMFGTQYALNEALVYSLQFSHLRTIKQKEANKSALSKDSSEIVGYIEKYRNELDQEVYNSQEYSIKLIQIPKISNTNRADSAIEFVKWNELSSEDQAAYHKIAVIVKDKRVAIQAANVRRLKPGEVVNKVNTLLNRKVISLNLHVTIYKLFNIRPSFGVEDPFETNAEFCLYDETHKDYVYQDEWVDFLVQFFQLGYFTSKQLRSKQKKGEILNVDDYRI